MECVDSNANTYIEKLDKLVLSMIESDNESDTESSSSDDDMTESDESDANDPDTSDDDDKTDSGQEDEYAAKNDIPFW